MQKLDELERINITKDMKWKLQPEVTLKITKEFLKEKGACTEGKQWVTKHKLIGLEDTSFLRELMEAKQYRWANWLIVRVMDYKQYVSYAVFAAEQVLDIYEKKYPTDKRPRLAIEAAKKCIEDPSEENKQAARIARNAYAAAADAGAAAAAAAAYAYAAAAYNAAAAADAAAAAADARKTERKWQADKIRELVKCPFTN